MSSLFHRLRREIENVRMRRRQDAYDASDIQAAHKLALFFVPKHPLLTGGIMSIFSLCKYTRETCDGWQAAVVTAPASETHCRNDLFPNRENVWRFDRIIDVAHPDELVLHVPEMMADVFVDRLSERQKAFVRSVPRVRINILNQNVACMPERSALKTFFTLTDRLTQTTAHERYATQEVCDRYGIPTHLFSTFLAKDGWPARSFPQKERLIAVSPDDRPEKAAFLRMLAARLPDYRVVEIRNLTFSEYLDTIARAFAVVTFGEGFDWYYMQPTDVGSVSYTVYNDAFFPDETWRSAPGVKASYGELTAAFAEDIRFLETYGGEYARRVETLRARLAAVYRFDGYVSNLRRYYAGDYDFIPQTGTCAAQRMPPD